MARYLRRHTHMSLSATPLPCRRTCPPGPRYSPLENLLWMPRRRVSTQTVCAHFQTVWPLPSRATPVAGGHHIPKGFRRVVVCCRGAGWKKCGQGLRKAAGLSNHVYVAPCSAGGWDWKLGGGVGNSLSYHVPASILAV